MKNALGSFARRLMCRRYFLDGRDRAGAGRDTESSIAAGSESSSRSSIELDLEKYKATIKGLTQFGDRRQGTDRNKAALDWIEAQLKSYGCTNTERITYTYPSAAASDPDAPARGTGAGAAGRGGRGRGTGETGPPDRPPATTPGVAAKAAALNSAAAREPASISQTPRARRHWIRGSRR